MTAFSFLHDLSL